MGSDSNISETSKKRRLISDSEVKPVKLPNIDHQKRESENGNITDKTENVDFNILVSNLPDNWNYNMLHTFFIKLFTFKKLDFQNEDNFDGSVKLMFDNKEQYEIAYQKLDDVYADDRKLHFKTEIKEENNESVDTLVISEKSEPQTPPSISSESNNELDSSGVQALESFEIDPSGLYGLKPSFLASLGIKPPIDSWVHVSNFRCDDPHLRNVMELAGHIVIFSAYLAPKYAKIMYSHPLEAVQAVSMLNGREYYGNKLKIIMIPNPGDMITLPKGLAGIGPGLGSKGKPLRDIEKHFHRFLSKKPTALNMSIFRTFCDNQQFTPINNEDAKMACVSTSNENSDKTKKLIIDSTKKSQVQKKPHENKLSIVRNAKKKVFESSSYKYSSESDISHSSPEPDHSNSKCSDEKTSCARSRSGSSNCSSISKNQLNSPKNIETIGVRQNLRASHAGPRWTPNVPFSIAAKPSFGPGQIPRFPVGIIPQRPMQSHITGQIKQTAPIAQFGSVGQSRPSGPMGQFGPMGQSGTMGQSGPMGPSGSMGQSVSMVQSGHMGLSGPMIPPGHMVPSGPMRPSGSMVPSGPMGPSGPLISGPKGPPAQMGNPGPIQPAGPISLGNGQNVEPVMLEFKNLPLNTTMPFLCQQLSDIGQVVSLQFTTPGCALVRFANMAQAQMCFQRYNRTYAEGCLLEVRFV